MQISSQTDNQKKRKSTAINENFILKKKELKFQNLILNPIQNSVPEQAKVDRRSETKSWFFRPTKSWFFCLKYRQKQNWKLDWIYVTGS